MSVTAAAFNLLKPEELAALGESHAERFEYRAEGGAYLNLRGLPLALLREIDGEKIASLCRVVRALGFAAVDGAKSGHPGGSTSKAEQLLALLTSGVLAFDAVHPKHPGRDRLVWSAGHTTPLFHSLLAVVYETLRRKGIRLAASDAQAAVYPEQLARFRRWGGPSGHVESQYALADTSPDRRGTVFRRDWASRSCIADAASRLRRS